MEVFILFFKTFVAIELLFFLLYLFINIYGIILGNSNKFTYTNTYFQLPELMYDALLNVNRYTEWMPGLISIHNNDELSWFEKFEKQYSFKNRLIGKIDKSEISIQRISEKMNLVIERKFIFSKESNLTLLTIEDQFYYNKPYSRTLVHLFYKHKANMKNYMQCLESFLEKN